MDWVGFMRYLQGVRGGRVVSEACLCAVCAGYRIVQSTPNRVFLSKDIFYLEFESDSGVQVGRRLLSRM